MTTASNTARQSHAMAVLTIACVAIIWGVGFPVTHIALEHGTSVGTLMSARFILAALVMAAVIRLKRIPVTRRGLLDGLWLGMVLAIIFWSQTDGMRFTSTAKSGFITGLYVLFTPLIAVMAGQKVKRASAIAAVIATFGFYLLVHLPGGWWSGLNRGDLETLVCALLCAVHIVMMGVYTRRSNAWLLAGTQVAVCGVLSVILTAALPAPDGFHNLTAAMSQPLVLLCGIYLALFSTVFAFWGQARAQTALGPTESAVLFSLEPVTAAILSVVWLHEPMSGRQALGGTLIVVAMIVSEALPVMYRAITTADTRP